MGPKCMYPDKREAEGHLTPHQGEGDGRVSREREKTLTLKRGGMFLQIKGLWKTQGQVLPQSLQKEEAQQDTLTLAQWSLFWNSGAQNWEAILFCCLKCLSCDLSQQP